MSRMCMLKWPNRRSHVPVTVFQLQSPVGLQFWLRYSRLLLSPSVISGAVFTKSFTLSFCSWPLQSITVNGDGEFKFHIRTTRHPLTSRSAFLDNQLTLELSKGSRDAKTAIKSGENFHIHQILQFVRQHFTRPKREYLWRVFLKKEIWRGLRDPRPDLESCFMDYNPLSRSMNNIYFDLDHLAILRIYRCVIIKVIILRL